MWVRTLNGNLVNLNLAEAVRVEFCPGGYRVVASFAHGERELWVGSKEECADQFHDLASALGAR